MSRARSICVVALVFLIAHPVLAETNTVYNFLRTDVSSRAAAQVVSMWKDHAKSAGSTRLARPL